MKGILQEGEEMLKKYAAANVLDAALIASAIASAQKVEHYEMARYATVLAYAKLLNEKEECLLKEILTKKRKAVEGAGAM